MSARLVALWTMCVMVAALGLLAAGSVASAASSAAALPPCVRAQALLDAGYPADAEAAFKADLGQGDCAQKGLAAVRSAQAADANNRFNAAVTKIRRLEAAGFESEARTQTQALVLAFPKRMLPADIRAVSQPVGWWRQFGGDVGPAVRAAIEIVAVLLVALVLARAVVAVIARAVRPSFTVQDISGLSGTDVVGQTGLLSTELDHIGGTEHGNPIRRVSASEGEFTLPEAITSAYPQAGIAAAAVSLLDRVLPRRLWEVSATALPVEPVRGAGLTVVISRRGGRQKAEMTIWEGDFGRVSKDTPLTERLERLALPAAAWLAYQPQLGKKAKALETLGTKNWRSYAFFVIGDRRQKTGEIREARRAYHQALDADPSNLGARLNLAGLLLYRRGHDSTEAPYDPSSRLALASWLLTEAELHQRMSAAKVDKGLRWRWLYLTAAMYLATQEPKKALDKATTLYREVTSDPGAQSDRAALAREMRWPAYVLNRSAQMLVDKHMTGNALDEVGKVWWTANTLYNLACYHARATEYANQQKELQAACRNLRDAIDRATEPSLMMAMAQSDPVLGEVVKMISAEDRSDLTGAEIPEPPHTADIERGRGIGIEIREAVKTLMHRNGGVTAQHPKGSPQ